VMVPEAMATLPRPLGRDLHESVKARIFPVAPPEPVPATQNHIESAALQPAFEGSATRFSKRKIQVNQRKTNGAHAQASRSETELKDNASMSEDELFCLPSSSHRRKSI
ncbi:hypothetical protein MMC31_005476, partial [Peltigera leucophlebia]|nr:hypothetical protein [Peltigera leucophlebia]